MLVNTSVVTIAFARPEDRTFSDVEAVAGTMDYADLVTIYTDLESTASTLEKTEILRAAFIQADADHLEMVVTLVRGAVFADWESEELGVSSTLALEAIEKATGISATRIKDWWREEGDLGSAAATAVEIDILPALKGEDSRALGYYGSQLICSLGRNDPEV